MVADSENILGVIHMRCKSENLLEETDYADLNSRRRVLFVLNAIACILHFES
jgi:hypothetical protein